MIDRNVHVDIVVNYNGTIIHKSVTVPYKGETDVVMVNQGLEYLTKKIQIMVQSEQGVTP